MTTPNIPEFPETIEERQKYLAALDLQRTQEDLHSLQHQQITRAIDQGYERLRRENLPEIADKSKYPNPYGLDGSLRNETVNESISMMDGRIWNAIRAESSVEKRNLKHLFNKSRAGVSQDAQEKYLNIRRRKVDDSFKKVLTTESLDLDVCEGLTRLNSLADKTSEREEELYNDLESIFGSISMGARPDVKLASILQMFLTGHNRKEIIEKMNISYRDLKNITKEHETLIKEFLSLYSIVLILCVCSGLDLIIQIYL